MDLRALAVRKPVLDAFVCADLYILWNGLFPINVSDFDPFVLSTTDLSLDFSITFSHVLCCINPFFGDTRQGLPSQTFAKNFLHLWPTQDPNGLQLGFLLQPRQEGRGNTVKLTWIAQWITRKNGTTMHRHVRHGSAGLLVTP